MAAILAILGALAIGLQAGAAWSAECVCSSRFTSQVCMAERVSYCADVCARVATGRATGVQCYKSDVALNWKETVTVLRDVLKEQIVASPTSTPSQENPTIGSAVEKSAAAAAIVRLPPIREVQTQRHLQLLMLLPRRLSQTSVPESQLCSDVAGANQCRAVCFDVGKRNLMGARNGDVRNYASVYFKNVNPEPFTFESNKYAVDAPHINSCLDIPSYSKYPGCLPGERCYRGATNVMDVRYDGRRACVVYKDSGTDYDRCLRVDLPFVPGPVRRSVYTAPEKATPTPGSLSTN